MSDGETTRILEATRRWAAAFEGVGREDLGRFTALADPAIRFRDPFNDVTGHAAFARIFEDMFESCVDPRFEVLDVAAGERAGYIRWVFHFRPKAKRNGPEWRIDGMSEIQVGADGRIIAHIDHWDSGNGLLAKLPMVGPVVRWIFRRLSAG